jgi:hypothetical protein
MALSLGPEEKLPLETAPGLKTAKGLNVFANTC